MKFTLSCALLLSTIGLLRGAEDAPAATAEETTAEATEDGSGSLLIDDDDGWFDISKFVDQAYGFVPLMIPITEPAVGYGLVALVAFMDKPDKVVEGEAMRPNITAVGGLATENGTWGVFGADIRNWFDGSVESLVAAGYVDVNLRFYQAGSDPENAPSLEYNMKVPFGNVRGRYRFKGTSWSAALGYTLSRQEITITGDVLPPGVNEQNYSMNDAALAPLVTYDSRDNIFTPRSGLFAQLSASLHSEAWGGDKSFQIPKFLAFGYYPATDDLTLGLKVGARSAHGDVPFYQLPFIQLRGVPALRYQGELAAETEAEVRWQFYKRFSLVGFTGYGRADYDFEGVSGSESVTTYGLGFRYEIARGYGMHMGIDIARGPESTIFYVQFGSAWFSP